MPGIRVGLSTLVTPSRIPRPSHGLSAFYYGPAVGLTAGLCRLHWKPCIVGLISLWDVGVVGIYCLGDSSKKGENESYLNILLDSNEDLGGLDRSSVSLFVRGGVNASLTGLF